MDSVLQIDDPEALEHARAIAERTGQPLSAVVLEALRHERERLAPVPPQPRPIDMEKVMAAIDHASSLPRLTDKSTQEICDEAYEYLEEMSRPR